MATGLALLSASFAISVEAAECSARSDSSTRALVELYTSQGCPRCATAQRWLSGIARRADVLAVAIRADEPGSARDTALRQRRLTPLQRLALVSMPQVLLQGREYPGWDRPGFDEALERIAARPAAVLLRLDLVSAPQGEMRVRAGVGGLEPGKARLYVAAYQRSADAAPLQVGEWHGPFTAPSELRLPAPPGGASGGYGVVGFVQNQGDSEVLQALMLPACP